MFSSFWHFDIFWHFPSLYLCFPLQKGHNYFSSSCQEVYLFRLLFKKKKKSVFEISIAFCNINTKWQCSLSHTGFKIKWLSWKASVSHLILLLSFPPCFLVANPEIGQPSKQEFSQRKWFRLMNVQICKIIWVIDAVLGKGFQSNQYQIRKINGRAVVLELNSIFWYEIQENRTWEIFFILLNVQYISL